MRRYIDRQNIIPGFFFMALLCTCVWASAVLAESSTPEKTLAWCEIMANEAFDMAREAQTTIDYPMANCALSSAEEAGYHLAKVIRLAHDTADQRLAWSAYRVSRQVEAAIAKIILACRDIAARSSDPDVVHAANYLLENCELVNKENRASMEIALMPFKGVPKSAEAYSQK